MVNTPVDGRIPFPRCSCGVLAKDAPSSEADTFGVRLDFEGLAEVHTALSLTTERHSAVCDAERETVRRQLSRSQAQQRQNSHRNTSN